MRFDNHILCGHFFIFFLLKNSSEIDIFGLMAKVKKRFAFETAIKFGPCLIEACGR